MIAYPGADTVMTKAFYEVDSVLDVRGTGRGQTARLLDSLFSVGMGGTRRYSGYPLKMEI